MDISHSVAAYIITMLHRVYFSMVRRAQLCIGAGDNHLQHLPWRYILSTFGYSINFCIYAILRIRVTFSRPILHNKENYAAVATHSTIRKLTAESYNYMIIHSLVFSLEGRAWQEPEPSHVTGMALAHCILGKFLGVVCHCFTPSYMISFFIKLWNVKPDGCHTQPKYVALLDGYTKVLCIDWLFYCYVLY